MNASPATAPFRRLHHVAYVVRDQEATRHFYEDLIGLPLVATWAEVNEISLFPGRKVEYCHTFYGLGDGSALAFFAFADEDVYEAVSPKISNGFTHSAVAVSHEAQEHAKARLETAGLRPYQIDHGYCRSLYVNDPDGMVVELTSDPPDIANIQEWQAITAHGTLSRWLGGDRAPNNDFRNQ
jgi:catechol 2,3-dioxygenase-like lactoylglutathione lyase family enzyme